MTVEEFSSEFDILYNNIMSNLAPGLTEYEKSVFLTKAQEALVIEIYKGQYNGAPFENSEETRSYLRNLVFNVKAPTIKVEQGDVPMFDPSRYYYYTAHVFDKPDFGIWFTLFESVQFAGNCPCAKDKTVVVKPITYDEYWAILRDPFKSPNINRVIRLDKDEGETLLISPYEIASYFITYLRKPDAIILEDIPEEDPSINGSRQKGTCTLVEALHRPILNRAVQMAKEAWGTTQQQ